jgi:hypothetical protein
MHACKSQQGVILGDWNMAIRWRLVPSEAKRLKASSGSFFSFGRQVNLLPITESFWDAHHYQCFLKAMSSESGKGGIMTENESWNL